MKGTEKKKPPRVVCVCGGGAAHHRIEPECWCTNCLRLPEAERCREFRPVASTPVEENRRFVGHAHPETSRVMEDRMLPRVGSLRRTVIDIVTRKQGCTDDELEDLTGRSHQSVSAVRNSLMNDGWLVDSGDRRRTRYGNDAIVWVRNR